MALRIDVLTLFPSMVEGVFRESLLGKAQDRGLVNLRVVNVRDFSQDKHHTADDRPYGGGPGMLLKPEPLHGALQSVGAGVARRGPGAKRGTRRPLVIFMSPQGRPWSQDLVDRLAKEKHLVLVAGHYEGIDERILDWVDLEVSLGDVVLTGGEIPAMALADAVARKVPGVVKESDSLQWDSFAGGWKGQLDCPHYTRPALWKGRAVPPVLLSGDHGAIQAWREQASRDATKRKRPDLIQTLTTRRGRATVKK